jgi:hypothetical protein
MSNAFENLNDTTAPDLRRRRRTVRSKTRPLMQGTGTNGRIHEEVVGGDLQNSTIELNPSGIEKIAARATGVVKQVFELLPRVAFGSLCAIGTWLLILNYDSANSAMQALFNLAPELKRISAGQLTVEFNEETVGRVVTVELDHTNPNAHNPVYMSEITRIIRTLSADEYRRLMYIGQLQNLCAYSHPSLAMERDLSADTELEEKGLVERQDAPQLRTTILSNDNGRPMYCYTMKLTAKGADVKTALVKTIGPLLEGKLKLQS